MRRSRWCASATTAATLVVLTLLATGVAAEEAPLAVTPAAQSVSVRVGDSLEFAAVAPGEGTFAWLLWGRTMATGRTWTYVPGPEDAGWQQVTLRVTDTAGRELRRTWDVGVVPAVPPELVDVAPPAGLVEGSAGSDLSFSIGARVPAARDRDRVRFEWTVDGKLLRREEGPAAAATSQVTVRALEPGSHRVAVRVSEDDRVAALTDWTVEVPAPSPPPAAPPTTAPAVSARLATLPGPRTLARRQGEPLVLAVRVEPEDAPVSFAWTVNGRRVRAAGPRFDFDADSPGRHRITVTATLGGRPVGRDAWMIDVVAPEPPPLPSAPPPPVAEPPPSGLAEEEIRRWLADYARAWSRKDVAALRRMGQVRSTADAEKLERYFQSVSDIRVDVRVRSVRIDGDRASVEFERVDTVTDPGGRKQELRLPPLKKQIERTPEGLRFAEHGGAG